MNNAKSWASQPRPTKSETVDVGPNKVFRRVFQVILHARSRWGTITLEKMRVPGNFRCESLARDVPCNSRKVFSFFFVNLGTWKEGRLGNGREKHIDPFKKRGKNERGSKAEKMGKHKWVNADQKMNLFGCFRGCLKTERAYVVIFCFNLFFNGLFPRLVSGIPRIQQELRRALQLCGGKTGGPETSVFRSANDY